MFFRLRWEPQTKTRGRRPGPTLEPLEDRLLLTLFTVSAVPDATMVQEATATVTHSSGATKVARASLAGEAAPAGMGNHYGAFYLGTASDVLQIDSAPGVGQNVGDPITVAFRYSYTSVLQNFDGYPPQNPAQVEWHGFLDAGAATQPLFDGYFSTDFTPGDETQDGGVIPISMNVGDRIIVHISSSGSAYAAEPHYKDRVAFSADFLVEDQLSIVPVAVASAPAPGPLSVQVGPGEQPRGGSSLPDALTAAALGSNPLAIGPNQRERTVARVRTLVSQPLGGDLLAAALWSDVLSPDQGGVGP